MNKTLKLMMLMLFTFHHISYTQNQHLLDSLNQRLKTAKHDTTRVAVLYALSSSYWGNNPSKALEYANQILAISNKTGYQKGKAYAYNSMGNVARNNGNYLEALDYYKKVKEIKSAAHDDKGIASSSYSIGVILTMMGNYPESLSYLLTALKLHQQTGNKHGLASSYSAIGILYIYQANYPEALKNLSAALKINEELGDNGAAAMVYSNIGGLYINQGNYPEALRNFFNALRIRGETGDKLNIAETYENIGAVYLKQGNLDEAMKTLFAALKINEEIGNKVGIASTFGTIGEIYFKQKKYYEASQYLNRAISLSEEIGHLENMKWNYLSLSDLAIAQGSFKQALENYKLYITYRDSLMNEENTQKITRQQMQYEFEKKESLSKAEQDKKEAVAQQEIQTQKFVRNGFMTGFAVVLIFAGVFFKQRNKITREKKISEAERKNAEAEKERSEELLLNILPAEVATELKQTGHCQAKTFSMVTVMFTDFKDFTNVSEKVSGELLVDEINYCFSAFDRIIQKYKVEKIKTVGDAYICVSGLPILNFTHAFEIVNAAIEIRNFMLARKIEKESLGEIPFELRIGIHTGPVVAGIVGVKKFQYDIWGDTVNLAARMEQNCEAGKVNISGHTHQLIKDKFSCTHRGKIHAKNKGEIDMYFVEDIV